MDLGNGLGHLTYSTLVHPGDTWDDMWTVAHHLRAAGAEARSARPRRSACRCGCRNASAATLVKSKPRARQAQEASSPTTTCISTPSTRSPTGRSRTQSSRSRSTSRTGAREERTQYTMNVADILADVVPDEHRAVDPERAARLQAATSPGRTWSTSYTEHVLRVAAHLIDLEKRTGRTVTLALEPEPFCFLETTDETVDYFTNHLYTGAVRREAGEARRHLPISEAHRRAAPASRHRVRHLPSGGRVRGHRRVAAEAGRRRHSDLQAAGSRGAAHSGVTQEIVDTLQRYAKTIYLTQTVEKKDGKLNRFLNLDDAFAAWEKRPRPARMAHALPRAGVPRRSRRSSAPRASPSRTR